MRPISYSLQDHDLIILRVIGEWWELDLTGENKQECIQALSETLPQINLGQELEFLPPEESEAMYALAKAGGRLPIAKFSRQFGEVREMGPAALAREEPWYAPESPAEDLWYRGLIYKGFDETPEGMVEFIYLPDEFQTQLSALLGEVAPLPAGSSRVETESPKSPPSQIEVVSPPPEHPSETIAAVDDVTTLLTLAQAGKLFPHGRQEIPYLLDKNPARANLLLTLAEEMGLLRLVDNLFRPTRKAVGWLQSSREVALHQLGKTWQQSDWNELRYHPALICEGSGWYNDPITARTTLLQSLPRSPDWYRVSDLVAVIKETDPDFQRPNGNYNTWYIRDGETKEYISGFEAWDKVEGRLLHYLIDAPMVWLGLVITAGDKFRLTHRGLALLEDHAPSASPDKAGESIQVHGDGTITISPAANRYHRFQAGRIADLLPATPGQPYTYRLTAKTLKEAREQGITPQRVLDFLGRASDHPLPASTRRALERWAEYDTEARLEQLVVLRVSKADILQTLRQQPKTRPFLGESLGDLAVVVNAAHWPDLVSAAAQLGLLLEPPE